MINLMTTIIVMTITGVIPFTLTDQSPVPLSYSPEFLPIDYRMIDGVRCFKPVCQCTLENMVLSGVERIVMVVDESRPEVMRFFGDGLAFGVPVVYMWRKITDGVADAADAAYPVAGDDTVIFAAPAATSATLLPEMLESHNRWQADLTIGVNFASLVGKGGELAQPLQRGTQVADVAIWEPSFTELLRAERAESGHVTLVQITEKANAAGLKVCGVFIPKGDHTKITTFDEWRDSLTLSHDAIA